MKLSNGLITRLIWLVKTSWRFGIRDCFFFVKTWKKNFRANTAAQFFFEKKLHSGFLKKKVIFVLLAFETCQGAIWSSHSVIRVLINLHYDPTLFEAFHSVSFCEISVRFCHHKNRTQISKNFHCAFLFSIPLSYYNPYDDIPIFFHTWIFLLTSNYDIFTWFLWHLYDVVCVK